MKKSLKMLVIIFILLLMCLLIMNIFETVDKSLAKDKKRIEKIINNKYPYYEIENLELQYVDWSSTVQTIEPYYRHKATRASVIIKNENEQRSLYLKKELLGWKVSSDYPDYGINVPDDIYFIEVINDVVGRATDMDNFIEEKKAYNYWLIPQEDGAYYRKSGSDEDWYYIISYYRNIYKTQGGQIYVFNKDNNTWEKSDNTYSSMYSGRCIKMDMKSALEIIDKYTTQ